MRLGEILSGHVGEFGRHLNASGIVGEHLRVRRERRPWWVYGEKEGEFG